MYDSNDYEYSGRQSKYPPLLLLLGYFGFGVGLCWLSFDRLATYRKLEEASGMLRLMIRVSWLENLLYGLGGKYLVFSFGLTCGLGFILAGISRLRTWLRVRNRSGRSNSPQA